jgi:hypothetical protein
MRGIRARLVVSLVVVALIVTGVFVAQAQEAGSGTFVNGILFNGPGSGADPTAGSGAFHAGSARADLTVLLPSALGYQGGQDENHVLATIRGNYPGYWIRGARIRPFAPSGTYPLPESGTLTVWLNKAANTTIPFSYMTFGINND